MPLRRRSIVLCYVSRVASSARTRLTAVYFLPNRVKPFFSAGAAAPDTLRRPGRPAPKEESAAGLVSFLANAGLANALFAGAGAASFLAPKEPKEKPFLAGLK